MFKAAAIIALLYWEKPISGVVQKIPPIALTCALIAVALFLIWTAMQPGAQTRKAYTLAWMLLP